MHIILLFLLIFSVTAIENSFSQSIFDGPKCAICIEHFPHLGDESISISEEYAAQVCQSFQTNNGIKTMEAVGQMRFGSVEAYYENLYRVACEMDNQSPPLFIGIERNGESPHLQNEVFEYLSKINPEAAELLLNRPRNTTSQSRETILDMIIRQQRGAQRGDFPRALEALKIYEQKVRDLGGKRYRDLNPAEIRRYGMEPLR